jgi:hypothetical protein
MRITIGLFIMRKKETIAWKPQSQCVWTSFNMSRLIQRKAKYHKNTFLLQKNKRHFCYKNKPDFVFVFGEVKLEKNVVSTSDCHGDSIGTDFFQILS